MKPLINVAPLTVSLDTDHTARVFWNGRAIGQFHDLRATQRGFMFIAHGNGQDIGDAQVFALAHHPTFVKALQVRCMEAEMLLHLQRRLHDDAERGWLSAIFRGVLCSWRVPASPAAFSALREMLAPEAVLFLAEKNDLEVLSQYIEAREFAATDRHGSNNVHEGIIRTLREHGKRPLNSLPLTVSFHGINARTATAYWNGEGLGDVQIVNGGAVLTPFEAAKHLEVAAMYAQLSGHTDLAEALAHRWHASYSQRRRSEMTEAEEGLRDSASALKAMGDQVAKKESQTVIDMYADAARNAGASEEQIEVTRQAGAVT